MFFDVNHQSKKTGIKSMQNICMFFLIPSITKTQLQLLVGCNGVLRNTLGCVFIP
jgi:hypothetical protein